MVKNFEDTLKDKSGAELAEMKQHLNNYVPYKQRMILDEIEDRERQSRQQAAIREEARKVTLETLEHWFRAAFDNSDDSDQKSNEDIIAEALEPLVSAGKLAFPRGGYLVTNRKSGIMVTKPAGKKSPAKPKSPAKKN